MASKRILIVDDEQRSLLFLRESLLVSGLNAEMVCVSSAETAFEAFQHQPFDLLIADICLVGTDGVDLLCKLRQLRPNLPAILVSGHHSATIEERIRDLSAVKYFRKPFAFDDFTLAVAHALQEAPPGMEGNLSAEHPSWAMEPVQRHLTNLLQDSGAQGVCLTDAHKSVITQAGSQPSLDQWIPPPETGDGSFNFTYYQGRAQDMYSARVGDGVYLVITFDRDRPSTRIGQVLQYTRRTVQELTRVLYSQPNPATAD